MLSLEPWEYLFLSIIHGSLIGGIILFFFSLFINLEHAGDHDANVDADADASLEIDTDVDIGIDTSMDVSTEVDHDINHGFDHVDHDGDVHSITDATPAPFLLLLSSFMLSFGVIGEIVYGVDLNPFIRVIIAFLIPIFATKLISSIWGRLAIETTYEIPIIKIDNQVTTLTIVDEDGGLVVAESTDIERPKEKLHLLGRVKMQAKIIPGNKPIPKGKIGYVVDIDEKRTLIIDEWPSPPKKNKSG